MKTRYKNQENNLQLIQNNVSLVVRSFSFAAATQASVVSH
jgi:hypothetical protein